MGIAGDLCSRFPELKVDRNVWKSTLELFNHRLEKPHQVDIFPDERWAELIEPGHEREVLDQTAQVLGLLVDPLPSKVLVLLAQFTLRQK